MEKIYLGIDIGTTTLSIVGVTENDILKFSYTKEHRGTDTEYIYTEIEDYLISLINSKEYEIVSIGMTGQMHGILFVDKDGKAVSPLYNWQNQLGNQIFEEGITYSEELEKRTGYRVPTGYGFATIFYLYMNSLVPKNAASFCTIADYIGMRLTGRKEPIIHVSNAASLGLFDINSLSFDYSATSWVRGAGLTLPEVTQKSETIGYLSIKNNGMQVNEQVNEYTGDIIPVSVAIGDNQASYLGAAKEKGGLLINCGTGSQVSIASDKISTCQEVRPYIDGKYLLTGSAICGGAAFATIEKFLEKCIALSGKEITSKEVYGLMSDLAEKCKDKSLIVDTRFKGTRENPNIRGSITNISMDNLNPENLVYGTLKGMADELYNLWKEFNVETDIVTGSGNAIRKNDAFKKILCETFGKEITLSEINEEAAYGAAIFGKMI